MSSQVTTNSNTTLELIPYSELCISPKNVRTILPSRAVDLKFAESIFNHGLIHNLTVVRSDDNPKAEVVAGGRRFAGIGYLIKKGKLQEDYLVPCNVKPASEAVVLSLVENEDREEMHMADKLTAYNTLVLDGMSEAEIAKQFGTKEREVQKVLRLANVHKSLFGLFKKDHLGVDQITAFASNPDQGLQLSVWKALGKNKDVSPHIILREMSAESVPSNSGIVRFVTLAAYRKAGGALVTDLFSEIDYLTDRTLLVDLAEKKMGELSEQYTNEGWKWVDVSLDGIRHIEGCTRISGKQMPVPKKLSDKLKALHTKHTKHEDSVDEWDDASIEISDQIENEINLLEENIHEEYTRYSAAVIKRCGVALSFNSEGSLYVIKGIQRNEDAPKPRVKKSDKTEEADTGTEPVEKGLSQTLVRDLGLYRRTAIAASVAKKPALAIDILNYSMVRSCLADDYYIDNDLLQLRVSEANNQTSLEDYESSVAGKELVALRATLDTGWLSLESNKERFDAFCALPKKAKDSLLAYCCAIQLHAGTDAAADDDAMVQICAKSGVSFKDYFRPNSANYFGRLTIQALLSLGDELFGSDFSERFKSAPKKDIVAHYKCIFESDTTEGLSAEEIMVRNNWVPIQIYSNG